MKSKKTNDLLEEDIRPKDHIAEFASMMKSMPLEKLKESHERTSYIVKSYETGNPKILDIMPKEHYEDFKVLSELMDIELQRRARVEKDKIKNNSTKKNPTKKS